MSEELKTEQVQPEQQEQPQYTEIEQAAMAKGWRPKEEYTGDPERWRSPEVFLALDEPLKRIEHQSKELKQLRQALEAFKEHHTKVEASAFDRAIKSLQVERMAAAEEGDTVKVLKVQEQIDLVKDQKAEHAAQAKQPVVQDVPALNPEFIAWHEKNSWYQSNKAMTAVADAYGKELAEKGYTPAQVLRQVEERVREEFPQKFSNSNTKRPMAVEPSNRGGAAKDTVDVSMTETERDIMRKIVRSGVMTEKEYRAELKRVKEQ